ncbi:MAG: dihydroneopterin aldolase [Chitinophagaceae bacterium]|nr:dihydroneopterin aldolase [Chitinophagaceae bacterium]MCZ2397391.1 dihydroneopterin aldolase [Chitinophagales bacterium]
MFSIELKNLRFFSAHGIYEEERVLGNLYCVNCTVAFPEPEGIIERIEDTVNYQRIFEIIRDRMNNPTPLLETVCMNIGKDIQESFPQLKSIRLSIEKEHPPVEGFEGVFCVTWNKEYQ